MSDIESKKYITTSVPTAVWLSSLILSFKRYKENSSFSPWLKQNEIQMLASQLCHKNIENARISQWCNGDHTNNTYNYLKAKGSLRRVTQLNEFNGMREIPDVIPSGVINLPSIKESIKKIVEWYKNVYSKLNFECTREEIEMIASGIDLIEVNDANGTEQVSKEFIGRIENCIKQAWHILANKVNGGLISVNKEASLQLHYAHTLQQLLPLHIFERSEKVKIELETGVNINGRNRNIDLFVDIIERENSYKFAVEMKCYREYASSGGKRGATDIFMKDVYFDLYLLEQYELNSIADKGILLLMTDFKSLVYPKSKKGKSWRYDISNNAKAKHGIYDTPIGGKEIRFNLNGDYEFLWKVYGDYFFSLLKRKTENATSTSNTVSL
ncbi:hypothetical protein PV797_10730 [Clostridiaceae bacterium M8S5]|nr:hypothetical protein PV797_10730 [Clostridiaceae bacterium M8S5]